MEIGYDAFISYRHIERDIAAARAVHRQIETYRIPAYIKKKTGKQRMGKVFRDQDELPLLADLGEGIRAALDHSQWLIVICTPDLPKSKWCMAEIDYFIELGRRDRILTLLVRGEPEESFPPQLRFTPDKDGGVSEREPLAADIRADSSGEMLKKIRTEKLRLLAPMLGVGYDDLRRRQRERRMKTIAGVSAAAAVFFAAFGGFSLYQAATISRQNTQLEERGRELKAERDNLLILQSLSLAEQSGTQLDYRNVAGAALLALEALPANLEDPERPLVPEAEFALRSAVLYDEWKDYRPIGSVLFPQARYNLALSLAPDGKTFALTGDASSMPMSYLYDTETLRLIGSAKGSPTSHTVYRAPSGAEASLSGAAYSRDGARLMLSTGGLPYLMNTADGSVERIDALESSEELEAYEIRRYQGIRSGGDMTVWDLVEDREVVRFETVNNTCETALSPDGAFFVYSDYHNLFLADLEKGQVVRNIPMADQRMTVDYYIAVSPDNRFLLRGCWGWVDVPGQPNIRTREGGVQLYDAETGELLWESIRSMLSSDDLPNMNQTNLLFSPDSRWVILPVGPRSFQVYDLEKREVAYENTRLQGDLSCASFNADGSVILTAGGRFLTMWDAQTGEELQYLYGLGSISYAAFTQEDRYIVSFGAGGPRAVQVWERSELSASSTSVEGLHTDGLFLPDGRMLLFGFLRAYGASYGDPPAESSMMLYDKDGQLLLSYPESEYAENAFLSPDGSLVFATVRRGDAYITRAWDVETGERLRDYAAVFRGISSDGQRLLRYDTDGNPSHTFEIYDADSGEMLLSGSEPGAKRELVFDSALKKYICAQENELLIREVGAAEPLLRLEDFPSKIDALGMWGMGCFSPDGSLAAAANKYSGIVEVYDLATGELAASLDSGETGANYLVWSPDGGSLLYTTTTRTMCWMINTGDWSTRFMLYDQPQSSNYGSFSPDSSVIYNNYYVRDAQTGDLLVHYGGAMPSPSCVDCSGDGKRFLLSQGAGNSNRTLLRVFEMASLEELMERAPAVVRERQLTAEERRYFGLE